MRRLADTDLVVNLKYDRYVGASVKFFEGGTW